MKTSLLALSLLVAGVLVHPGTAAVPQQPCRAPALQVSKQRNVFTESQENDLGDAVAERTSHDVRVIDDDAVTGELRRIGDALVRHLPPTSLHIQFFLVDLPEANAFVLPGGRVYVSRKMIGFTQSEDELAGVLGHELGHLIARQQTILFTRQLRDVLNITAVGDRQDIFEKYNRLMDNAGRKPGAFETTDDREDADQMQADLLGLYVVAAAGYDPQAHVRLWDRFAETKGKTGSFLSNLFGTTSPDAKRLREMMKGAAAIPAACIEARPSSGQDRYTRWQADVIGYVGAGRKESLHNVVSKTALTPRLRGEVTHLRFSPDGRAILAQDDDGITVLSREPFSPRFRIEAPEANPAQFTADSAFVVLYTGDLRVERWSVAEKKLVEVHEMVTRLSCLQTDLAPDARTLACLDTNLDLTLLDVAKGTQIFQRKAFVPDNSALGAMAELGLASRLITMGFSPDARFFAAAYRSAGMPTYGVAPREGALVFDLTTKTLPDLKGPARKLLAGGFVFTGPDQVVARNGDDEAKSARLRLPSGDVVEQLKVFPGTATAATSGNYLLIRPFQKYAVGIMDLAKGAVVKGNAGAAFDIHGQVFVDERGSGELALYNMSDNQVVASTPLPPDTLGRLRAATVSADFKNVAVSERTRGAVWDLTDGTRLIHIRGFQGGFFDEHDLLFADFPKTTDEARRLTRVDAAHAQIANIVDITDGDIHQFGSVLLARGPAGKGPGLSSGIKLEARDVHDFRSIWVKTWTTDLPGIYPSDRTGTVVLAWAAGSDTAHNEARKSPALWRQLSALKNTDGDYFLQVLDATTGTVKGALLVETGNASFRLGDVMSVDDWVAIQDRGNRVLVYSLSTGEQKGHVFGGGAVIAPGAGLLKVDNGEGRLAVYDLATMERRHDFTFGHDIALTRFSPDGRSLFVLTADQTAYVIDLAKPQ